MSSVDLEERTENEKSLISSRSLPNDSGAAPAHYIDLPQPGEALQVPDPASSTYRTISQKTRYESGVFNARKVDRLREVTISGMTLAWDYSDHNEPLRRLSGQMDLKRVTIVADTVHINMPVRFPQAEVRIFARKLIFTRDGLIDVTPLGNPDKPVWPGDEGRSSPGLPGTDGADAPCVFLNVETLHVAAPADGHHGVRVRARGADGQPGGDGGHLPVAGNPAPPKQTWEKFFTTLRSTRLGTVPFGIPIVRIEEHTGPGSLLSGVIRQLSLKRIEQCPAQLKDVHSLFIDAVVRFPPLYFYYTNWSVKHGDPNVVPADGAVACPSGKPGDGGAGGQVVLRGRISTHGPAHDDSAGASEPGVTIDQIVDVRGGEEGHSDVVHGAPPNQGKFARVKLEITFEEEEEKPGLLPTDHTLPKTSYACIKNLSVDTTPVTPKKGADAQPPLAAPGADGTATQVAKSTASWCHEHNAEAALAYARNACMHGNRELSRAVATHYCDTLVADDDHDGERRGQLHRQFCTLLQRLERDLDFFGNQLGWVPHLSVLGSLSHFQSLVKAAFNSLYLCQLMRARWDEMEDNVEYFSAARDATLDQLDEHRRVLRDTQQQYLQVQDDLGLAFRKGAALDSEVGTLMGEIRNKAQIDVRNRAILLGETRIAFGSLKLLAGGMSLLAQVVPVGQPVLGAVGNIGGQAAGGAFGAVEGLLTSALLAGEKDTVDSGSQISAQVAKLIKPYENQIADVVGKPFSRDLDKQIAATQKELEATNKEVSELASDKQALQELLNVPADSVTEQLERLFRLKGDDNLEEQKQLAAWIRQKTAERITELEQTSGNFEDTLKRLRTKRDEAQSIAGRAASLAKKKQQAQTRVKNALGTLSRAPADAADIYQGIRTLCISSEALQPKVTAEIQKLVGTAYHQPLADLNTRIAAVASEKEELVRQLERCESVMRAAADTISQCWSSLDLANQKLLGLSSTLDHSVSSAMLDIEQHARAVITEQLYFFAKAYQYRFLDRVDPQFYQLDEFIEKVRDFLQYSDREGESREIIKTTLQTGECEQMYNLLESRLRTQVEPLATDVQHNRLLRKKKWRISAHSLLDEQGFSALNTPVADAATGETRYRPITINLVRSGYASAEAIKLRIVDIDLTNVTLADQEKLDHGFSFGLSLVHSGVSTISDGKQKFLFRAQSPAERISWEFTNSIDAEGELVTTPVETSTVDLELMRRLTPGDVNVNDLLAAYRPGGSSDITLQRTCAGNFAGGRITDFEIEVELEEQPH